jgi:hypothetical protein
MATPQSGTKGFVSEAKTYPKAYPRDIKCGQLIKILHQARHRGARRRYEWRIVSLVERTDHNCYLISYLNADGTYDLYNRLMVPNNSKHEVRG